MSSLIQLGLAFSDSTEMVLISHSLCTPPIYIGTVRKDKHRLTAETYCQLLVQMLNSLTILELQYVTVYREARWAKFFVIYATKKSQKQIFYGIRKTM